MKRIKLGIVGVDSGQLLICDPCYLQSEGLETSERLINSAPIQKGDKNHKQIFNTIGAEVGIKFDSGYGDGAYSVYGYVNKHGAIVKVEIKMGDIE